MLRHVAVFSKLKASKFTASLWWSASDTHISFVIVLLNWHPLSASFWRVSMAIVLNGHSRLTSNSRHDAAHA
jgi:hypothetical protein